jgi:hypothetical protein
MYFLTFIIIHAENTLHILGHENTHIDSGSTFVLYRVNYTVHIYVRCRNSYLEFIVTFFLYFFPCNSLRYVIDVLYGGRCYQLGCPVLELKVIFF